MSKYIASIDQGTTSTRCILFDLQGTAAASAQKEHKQYFPQPGWVEHDALEIIQNTRAVMDSALQKLGITPTDILALGITNQRETTVIWNKQTGQPYHPAIVWQDTRTDSICNHLAREYGQHRFKKQTGLPLATYFSGPKIKWMLDQVPGLREDADKGLALFGTMDTWLMWNLSGGPDGGRHVTDVTNASRTLLMNLATLDWDPEILAALDIPRRMLPEIMPSSGLLAAARWDRRDVPITGALGDQQAALFGQTCFYPGEAKNTYGTGCFMLLNTGETPVHSQNGLLSTVGYQIGSQKAIYALEGSIAMAGSLVQWLRDNLHLIQKSSDIEILAASVKDNGGIFFVPAFSGLFAPYWRSDARGVIAGMTSYICDGHIARAVLEATAYQTREVLDAMEMDSRVKLRELRVDGGMVVNNLLMQFQADILNVPVVRPELIETTVLGAAYAAGLAVGVWPDTDTLRANWRKSKVWQPGMPENDRQRLYAGWKKAVQRTYDWVDG